MTNVAIMLVATVTIKLLPCIMLHARVNWTVWYAGCSNWMLPSTMAVRIVAELYPSASRKIVVDYLRTHVNDVYEDNCQFKVCAPM